jgi:type III secretion protein F
MKILLILGFLTKENLMFTDNKSLLDISQGMEGAASELQDELDKAFDEVQASPSDPGALAEYQAALSDYTLFRNTQSNTVKSLKDIASSIISNFR